MKKYICSICGYIYDEAAGISKEGISSGTKWEDLQDDWVCPVCGAPKSIFEEEKPDIKAVTETEVAEKGSQKEIRKLSFAEMSALCSNLAKGFEKQYRIEEAGLFSQLSEYYRNVSSTDEDKSFENISRMIQNDLKTGYSEANRISSEIGDRGALRALKWSEKVTKILNTILSRYEKKGNALLENTGIHICEICGFVYIGDKPPEVCPVCKVPDMKITQVLRR